MSYLKNKIKETLRWKKNPEYVSEKLGIPLRKYKELKKEIIAERKQLKKKAKFFESAEQSSQLVESVDLEKGEGKISGTFNYEPKTPEEIIELLKIDTKKWKLSQYWNKQMGDHWRVSALVTKLKTEEEDLLVNILDNWKPKKFKIPKSNIPKLKKDKEKVCGILSLQDIHFGKEGNETIDKDFEDTLINLLSRATASHYLENLYFIVGGDLINMDTFWGQTTKGTPVDNCTTATKAYEQAFDAMHWGINYAKAFCNTLTVVYIPGNHDRLSSFHLAHALGKSIDSKNIVWDLEYLERKVHTWNNNFNAFEHGDKPSKNTPLIYASEYPKEWGNTRNRTLFTGHYHQERKVEYVTAAETSGFIHKTLPSLCRSDYWHYSKKFTGNRRSGKIELQHPVMGNICELTYQAM